MFFNLLFIIDIPHFVSQARRTLALSDINNCKCLRTSEFFNGGVPTYNVRVLIETAVPYGEPGHLGSSGVLPGELPIILNFFNITH
ncbi:hypothetical protein K443DRAFT_12464 [Laccaria amethystina LaAM-08-1]|uniref:Unplaced genomic scaffold K443scaffold_278, whole genome shotgun sequence n=1 Tax=Laccaria amethystina LaAM-08-1 TaxID=1095629 RepID=A0A0C9X8U7_9AGAR|nr:hypothetical protein K443DRAFT_12464 [Laccaria amethystina LaAM-08-1]